MNDPEFQYLTGQARPGFPALFEAVLHYEPDADHFSLLQRLVTPRSALGQQVDLLLARALD